MKKQVRRGTVRKGGNTAVTDVLVESKSPALRLLLFLQVHNGGSLSSRPNIFSANIFCRASLFATVAVFNRVAPLNNLGKEI